MTMLALMSEYTKTLEDALKYTGRVIVAPILIGAIVANPIAARHVNAQTKSPIEYKTESKQKYLTIDDIKERAKERGYATIEELQRPIKYLKDAEKMSGRNGYSKHT